MQSVKSVHKCIRELCCLGDCVCFGSPSLFVSFFECVYWQKQCLMCKCELLLLLLTAHLPHEYLADSNHKLPNPSIAFIVSGTLLSCLPCNSDPEIPSVPYWSLSLTLPAALLLRVYYCLFSILNNASVFLWLFSQCFLKYGGPSVCSMLISFLLLSNIKLI